MSETKYDEVGPYIFLFQTELFSLLHEIINGIEKIEEKDIK
jgi:hypothetical protein